MRIGVVLTGRNDNYGGRFGERLAASVAANAAMLRRAGATGEWVFVEWNPLPDRPLTSTWLTERFDFVRAFVVPGEFHRAVCTNPDVCFMEYHAKNVGIRRAEHPFVVVTNPDVFWDAELADALAQLEPATDTVYRAVRVDVREDIADCALHVLRAPENRLRVHTPAAPFFSNAAGDFFAAHRSLFWRCRGHDENVRHARVHGDARICRQAHHLGMKFEILGRVYHVDHPGSYVRGVQPQHGGEFDYVSGIPYHNPADWGLAGFHTRSLGERVEQLVFEPERLWFSPESRAPATAGLPT